ncbi:hypothetical protein SEA_DONNY_79 [Mycobacterium phage Donny]|uniref:Uncharacterized protein n=1 Tax=Mycobacterium phage Donny TaxID=2530126 RepID=A0A481VRV4_9CAUD|nr:hypothetical protein SEA_DONNY_79 [Mycobacterium phage Donny]
MEGFRPTGAMRERMLNGEVEVLPGDDRVIKTTGRYTHHLDVKLVDIQPCLWWLAFGTIRPELLHDACWDGEAIR